MLETERLRIDPFTLEDAPFIITLLNTPGWLENIGNRAVRTLEDARQYLANGALWSYEQFGLGPYRVRLKNTETAIGMCGLFKRDTLNNFDIGFAFLPEYTGKGYGYESASAIIAYARDTFGLTHVAGITKPTNQPSIRLLEKLGMSFEKTIYFNQESPDNLLFGMSLKAS